MSLPELTIRPYRPGDEQRILETFNLVFREVCGEGYQDRTMQHWQWQYQQNRMGHRMSLAVAPDGTVVSQYAGVPLLCDTPYGPRVFVHCVDSMTHPAWRQGLKRPGIFVITGLPFSAHSRVIGDAVLYGFPVEMAERIGRRFLEYHFLRVIDYLCRDVAGPAAPAPAGIEVARVDRIPPDIGGLYDAMRADKQLLLRRDYQYLTWRYREIPSAADYHLFTARRTGRLVGFLVAHAQHELAPASCSIAEWMAAVGDEGAQDGLLHALDALGRERGRQRLLTVFPEWSPEWSFLQSRGFVKTASAQWLERRLVYLITGSPLSEQDLAEKWWYTLGDSDLI